MAINKFKHISNTPLNLSGRIQNDTPPTSPTSSVVFTESITISNNNTTGNGLILSDDGDFVDLNTGYGAFRFSSGIQVYSGNRSGFPVIQLESGGNINFVSDGGTTTRGVIGLAGGSDYWFFGGGATGTNAGFAQISTGDDGNEPIYVRQYTGDPRTGTLQRTATLLDASGNTSFPGTITGTFGGAINVSGVSTVGFLTATGIWNSGITTEARVVLNGANNTADNGGQIFLNGATGNRIDFAAAGVAAPSFTTRSVGTKINLYPQVSSVDVDYAFGIEGSTLWYSVPKNTNSFQHRWYGGTTQLADLKGSGELVIGSTSLTGTANQRIQVGSAATPYGAYISGSVGIGTTNPTSILDVIGTAKVSGIGTFENGNTTYGTTTALSLELGRNNNNNAGALKLWGTTSNAYGLIQATTGNLHVDSNGGGTYLNYYVGNFVSFGTGAGAESARFTGSTGTLTLGDITETGTSNQKLQVTGGAYVSGSVGIGTTTPQYNLDVVGDINFTGTFRQNGSAFVASRWSAGTGNDIYKLSGNVGIGSTIPTSKLDVTGDAKVSGVVTATTFVGALTGTATTATKLATARTFEITGDVVASAISFDGSGNVSLAATIQPNSVALGNDTTGDYVSTITGTSNQITVTGGTGETSTPTLSIPNQFTIPQDATVTRDLLVTRNLNVNGNITIGGTSAFIAATELKVYDPDIVLGVRTDGSGNDISTDNTANHGGIAIASTEGSPLITLYDVGIGETNPATYKKFMWFKSGSFSGLGTDAWLSNYAIGIGSTQFPTGTRLAVGNVQFTQNDLSVVRNINSSGVSTLPTLSGTTATYTTGNFTTGNITTGVVTTISGTLASYTTGSFGTGNIVTGVVTTLTSTNATLTNINSSGISTLGVTSATNLTSQQLNVSGLSTFAGITTVTGSTLFSRQLNVSGVSTYNNTAFFIPTASGVAGIFSGTTSNDLVRITQLGTGNALVIEDSTNPDSSPFVIDTSGRVGVGTTTPYTNSNIDVVSNGAFIFARNASTSNSSIVFAADSDYPTSFKATFIEKRGTSYAGNIFGSIPSADLGALAFQNTTNALIYTNGGSPLIFGTLSTERMRISGTGNVGIGTNNPADSLQIGVGVTISSTGNATYSGIITAGNTTDSTSTTTGAVQISGGLGVAKNLNVGAGLSVVGVSTFAGITTVTGSTLFSRQLNVSGVSTFAGITTVTGNTLFAKQLNVSGVSTIGNVRITPVGTGATIGATGTGIVTYYGDGSLLSGIGAGQFNSGITTNIAVQLTAIGSNVLTLPSTAGRDYIIHSISASNIAVGNTEVNVIGAFDFSGGERSYFAYNIPIPTGTSVELLKQPMVLNPSDIIVMRATDYTRAGIDTGVQVYISYQVTTNTNYFGVGVGSVSIASTSPTTIYTSTNTGSVLQSIHLTNRTDSGGYPVSVTITSGSTTTYLIDDLIVPKYGSVEILDNPKSIPANAEIQVIVDQTSTIDVQVSGIKL